jgi:hypothetical protein
MHNANCRLGVEVLNRHIAFVWEGGLLCQARIILRLPAEMPLKLQPNQRARHRELIISQTGMQDMSYARTDLFPLTVEGKHRQEAPMAVLKVLAICVF